MDDRIFDIAIVGGGPAGLFAAKHLLENAEGLTVLLLDKGLGAVRPGCPANESGCVNCRTCTVISGLGGAGLYSDGKLILDLGAGGYIQDFANLSAPDQAALVDEVCDTLLEFDGMSERGPSLSPKRQDEVSRSFGEAGFSIKLHDVLHVGTYNLSRMTQRLVEFLQAPSEGFRSSLQIVTKSEVVAIKQKGDHFVLPTKRQSWRARRVIFAAGKSGAPDLRPQLEGLGVKTIARPVWAGVRVEVPRDVIRELLAISFDPKISKTDARGRVKTHCFSRDGGLLILQHRGATLVGGHSRFTEANMSLGQVVSAPPLASFNVLASRYMGQSTIDELLGSFIKTVGSRVAVQDMKSFLDASSPLTHRTIALNDGVYGRTADIRAILDSYGGIGASIAEFVRGLATIYPGLEGPETRVIAPALEWDFGSVEVDSHMETSVAGLFAVGDGAGLSQGIVHAAATGLVAARHLSGERAGTGS